MGPYSSDEREQIAINRLDDHARQLFFEVLANERKPIAMVGSGLSIIYGGVSWDRSVRIALEEAHAKLSDALDASPKPIGASKARIERLRSGIEAYREDSALNQSSDKYVALELCEEAFDLLDDLKSPDLQGPDARKSSSFRQLMATIYKDDTHTVRLGLQTRFSLTREDLAGLVGPELAAAKALAERFENLMPHQVQQLASNIYSIPFLRNLERLASPSSPQLSALLRNIVKDFRQHKREGWTIKTTSLPVDRRGVICMFLATIAPAQRRKLLEQAMGFKTALRTAHRPILDPFRALQNWLRIERYITLNFDYELENNLMLDDLRAVYARPDGFERAIRDRTLEPEGRTGGYSRRFGDGLAASTDIYHEKAVARLFEFALGSTDYSAQILHLHGRADRPESMILTDGDTNRQYRRDRHSRTALEQALDVTLTGNPILFVGVGLSEAEITRALRELVSRGHATIHNPAFAIMTIQDGSTSAWRQQMSFYRQYGIHLIAAGLPGVSGDQALSAHLTFIARLKDRIGYLCPKMKAGPSMPPTPAQHEAAEIMLKSELIGKRNTLGLLRSPVENFKTHLKIDWAGFSQLYDDVCAAKQGSIPIHVRDSWLDYLDKIQAKLFSLVTIETLKSLRDGLKAYLDDRAITGSVGSLSHQNIRDALLWSDKGVKGLAKNVDRHLCLTTTDAFPDWAIDTAAAIDLRTEGVVAYYAPLGTGKGTIVRRLHEQFREGKRRSLIINCNLSIEFDSVLTIVLNFLQEVFGVPEGERNRIDRLDAMKSILQYQVADRHERPVIVLAGLERLVDSTGRPVSTELDLLLTLLLGADLESIGLQLVIVAANGCQAYVARLMGLVRRGTRLPSEPSIAASSPDLALAKERGLLGHIFREADSKINATKKSRYSLQIAIQKASKKTTEALAPNSARSPAISETLRIVLERWHELAFALPAPDPQDRLRAELDKEVLGQLAFVGLPTETSFLRHLLPIRKLVQEILRAPSFSPTALPVDLTFDILDTEIAASVTRLLSFGLLVELAAFPASSTPKAKRFALHRSVLAEVRERYGVRTGDELLSNSFSLTLASSMPTDLVVAEWDIHLRMKNTVGRLRGSWKDAELPDEVVRALAIVQNELVGKGASIFDASKQPFDEIFGQLVRVACHAEMPMHVNIRAAAGVIRGFFCAASLVALLPDTLKREDGDLGEFEEHKRRISNIMSRLRETVQVVEQIGRIEKRLTEAGDFVSSHPPLLKAFQDIKDFVARKAHIGPLYGTEIVWLLNEQAVIALLQGSLHEAKKGFADALDANRLFRSRTNGQAWRRLEVNRSLLLIETGRIGEAEVTLRRVKEALDAATIESVEESKTVSPLIDMYLALCAHLGGDYPGADKLYRSVIDRLGATGQQRALALAQMRRASLLLNMGESTEAVKAIGLSVAAAEAGRQMDILWRARLEQITVLNEAIDSKRIERTIKAAKLYARKMEFPRLEIHALRAQASYRLRAGDYEAAGTAAAEAMTIATRCGMTLQAIALRVIMGKILLLRGDQSGYHLLERAVLHADGIGYQLQVDRAQQAMLEANFKVE